MQGQLSYLRCAALVHVFLISDYIKSMIRLQRLYECGRGENGESGRGWGGGLRQCPFGKWMVGILHNGMGLRQTVQRNIKYGKRVKGPLRARKFGGEKKGAGQEKGKRGNGAGKGRG